jgi:hypothetical protein
MAHVSIVIDRTYCPACCVQPGTQCEGLPYQHVHSHRMVQFEQDYVVHHFDQMLSAVSRYVFTLMKMAGK